MSIFSASSSNISGHFSRISCIALVCREADPPANNSIPVADAANSRSPCSVILKKTKSKSHFWQKKNLVNLGTYAFKFLYLFSSSPFRLRLHLFTGIDSDPTLDLFSPSDIPKFFFLWLWRSFSAAIDSTGLKKYHLKKKNWYLLAAFEEKDHQKSIKMSF